MDFPPNMKSLSIAWFRKEDWQRWCEICPDFQPDYNHWLRRAEAKFQELQALGKRLQKVVIEPAEFLEWSRVNGGKIDTYARAEFAAFKAMRKDASH